MQSKMENSTLKYLSISKLILLFLLLTSFSQVSAEVRSLDLGQFYIEYESAGKSDFVILLEAGSGGDLTRWDAIFSELSKIGHTIRYTRIGNEQVSQVKQQFSAEEYAYHLKLFLQTLDISKPVIIVSHSYGALITRMFAANYPNRIAGMLFG